MSDIIDLGDEPRIVSILDNMVIANGREVSVMTHSSVAATTNTYVRLGAMEAEGFHQLNGQIFALRYYNRKLSYDEIAYNQRVDNVRFKLGVSLPNGIVPYVPSRSVSRTIEDE